LDQKAVTFLISSLLPSVNETKGLMIRTADLRGSNLKGVSPYPCMKDQA